MRILFSIVALAVVLAGETLKPEPKAYYNTFSGSHPVLQKVQVDDSILVRLPDAQGYNERGEKVAAGPNPLLGPIYVEGVEPGDAVLLRIQRLKLTRDWGWSSYRLGAYAVTPEMAKTMYANQFKENAALPGRSDLLKWKIDLDRKTVSLPEPATRRFRLEFAAQPMLGCIGVAGPGDSAPASGISGSWGGNLDYNMVAEGATVTIPAYHRGGLVYIGDPHALQADGEPAGTGIETSMEVQIQFGIVKKHPQYEIRLPRIETRDHMITIGSQPEFTSSLDPALQMATSEMVHWLADQWGADPWEAHMIVAFTGKYDVVTVKGSVALRVPASLVFQRPPAR